MTTWDERSSQTETATDNTRAAAAEKLAASALGHAPKRASDGTGEGLSTERAAEQRAKHGSNEVRVRTEPEWKKIAKRYLDWVSIIIVRTLGSCLTPCCTRRIVCSALHAAWHNMLA